jgi:hypothetical protein
MMCRSPEGSRSFMRLRRSPKGSRSFMRTWCPALAGLFVCATALAVEAQPSRTISGRVIADDTGEALHNARVGLSPSAQGTPVVLSDADGRFTIAAPAGRYSVVASKTGYARREAPIADNDRVDLRLVRSAAISGRVVDDVGDPAAGARVVAGTSVSPDNKLIGIAATETDDRGEYRIAGLAAGTYVVQLTTIGPAMITRVAGPNQIYSGPDVRELYYPAATTPPDAERLRLDAGDEHGGVDFVVPGAQLGNMILMTRLAAPGTIPPPPQGTGIVRGRVTTIDGRAVPRALVTLLPPFGPFDSTTTRADDDGRYEFRSVAAGKFGVVAQKVGYSAPGGTPGGPAFAQPPVMVEMNDGDTREKVDYTLAPWRALFGTIADEDGELLQGASVQLLQLRYEGGRRRLVPGPGSVRTTDDLGRYRLYGLPPGRYIVSAAIGNVGSEDLPGYARTYYPGTLNAADAQYVAIGTSQDVTNVDFSLQRTRTARIAGRILNAAGEPTTGGTVQLLPSARSAAVTSVPLGARLQNDGRFEFPNVPPGQYVIQANRGRSQGWIEGEFGALPVAVSGTDVVDLVLQMSAGSAVRGRFAFDTSDRSKPVNRSGIELQAIPIDPDASPTNSFATANIHPDWTFEMAGLNGPRRLQVVRTPAGWALKALRVNGIDATDRVIAFGRRDQSLSDVEVVLTDRVNEISGTVTDDRSQPLPGASVIVFSTDRGRWYGESRFLRVAQTSAEGAFTIAGLPAGSYYAAALAQLPTDGADAWQEERFLESLIFRASSVSLGDGQKQTLNLQLGGR